MMKSYQIMTNQTCNLACSYCYEKMNGKMNTVERTVSFLKACLKKDQFTFKDDDVVMLEFIGGEPTLNLDVIEKTTEYLKENGYKYGVKRMGVSLSSNGTRVHHKRFVDYMEKYKGCIQIGISIDGKKEKHDKHRITLNGNGSFDSALKGYYKAKEILGKEAVGIKATFTVDDIPNYAENVKYLMTLEPNYLYANFVFEEPIPKEKGGMLALQLMDCVDFYLKNNYDFTFDHIINDELLQRPLLKNRHLWRKPKSTYSEQAFCGAISYMKCIGFDDDVYGCNRFVTMGQLGTQIGILNKDDTITEIKSDKMELVKNYKQFMHDHCKNCYLNHSCANCMALPVELGCSTKQDFEKFYFEKRHCYFTKAKELAKQYYLIKRGIK